MFKQDMKAAFDSYARYLSESRYASAGYGVGKGYTPRNAGLDDQLSVLASYGIKTKKGLKDALLLEGVTFSMLEQMQTPYFDEYGEDGHLLKQTENPSYAQPINDITFDDVYAIQAWYNALPE